MEILPLLCKSWFTMPIFKAYVMHLTCASVVGWMGVVTSVFLLSLLILQWKLYLWFIQLMSVSRFCIYLFIFYFFLKTLVIFQPDTHGKDCLSLWMEGGEGKLVSIFGTVWDLSSSLKVTESYPPSLYLLFFTGPSHVGFCFYRFILYMYVNSKSDAN